MRRALLLSLLVGLAGAACADTYRDALIAKCPSYQAGVTSFKPVYPALARQVTDDYGVREGVCIDVGGGPGFLGFELAKLTGLTVYNLDIDPWAVRLCNLLAEEQDLVSRVRGIEGDACDMPFRDGFADLVVSRGSIFFWPDQFRGLMECYRVLKPGGVAYVGGGFSRILDPAVRTPLAEWAKQRFVDANQAPDGWRPLEPDLVDRLRAAGVKEVRLDTEPITGWWIEMRK